MKHDTHETAQQFAAAGIPDKQVERIEGAVYMDSPASRYLPHLPHAHRSA